MKPLVVFYATREGQTRRIAEHMVDRFHKHGHQAQVLDVAQAPTPFDFGNYSAAVLAASVHIGQHEPEMVRFVRMHREQLDQLPSAFISVSLAEAGAEDPNRTLEQREGAHEAAEQALEHFFEKTSWRPLRGEVIAGALRYSQYNPIIRFVMKQIARSSGAPTDTSRDYEFTDWPALDAFTDELVDPTGPRSLVVTADQQSG